MHRSPFYAKKEVAFKTRLDSLNIYRILFDTINIALDDEIHVR